MVTLERPYIGAIRLQQALPTEPYWVQLPVVRHLQAMEKLELKAPVTFFVGENGTGKSTLLEAIAVASGFNAEGGTRNFRFSTKDTHADLHQYLTLSRYAYPQDGFFLRAESLYNLASNIDDMAPFLDKEEYEGFRYENFCKRG